MTTWYKVKVTFKTDKHPLLDERLMNLLGQFVTHYTCVKSESEELEE